MTIDSNQNSTHLAIVGILALAFVYYANPALVGIITREDGFVENLTAFYFAGGMLASLYALYHKRTALLAGIWAVLCLFFLGEEVSWFQRVFDYSVPFVEQRSTQTEFNFHNLNIINLGRMLNEDGTLEMSAASLVSSQNLFRLGFAGYFLALPMATLIPVFRRLLTKVGYKTPSLAFLTAVWGVVAISFVLAVITVAPVKNYVAEMREVFYAAVIFAYTLGLAFDKVSTHSETTIPSRIQQLFRSKTERFFT